MDLSGRAPAPRRALPLRRWCLCPSEHNTTPPPLSGGHATHLGGAWRVSLARCCDSRHHSPGGPGGGLQPLASWSMTQEVPLKLGGPRCPPLPRRGGCSCRELQGGNPPTRSHACVRVSAAPPRTHCTLGMRFPAASSAGPARRQGAARSALFVSRGPRRDERAGCIQQPLPRTCGLAHEVRAGRQPGAGRASTQQFWPQPHAVVIPPAGRSTDPSNVFLLSSRVPQSCGKAAPVKRARDHEAAAPSGAFCRGRQAYRRTSCLPAAPAHHAPDAW